MILLICWANISVFNIYVKSLKIVLLYTLRNAGRSRVYEASRNHNR